MDSECKLLKRKIRSYLSGVNHHVSVFLYRGVKMVDVVYEDFYSESRVHNDIVLMAGTGSLIHVKRECSEEMMDCLRASMHL